MKKGPRISLETSAYLFPNSYANFCQTPLIYFKRNIRKIDQNARSRRCMYVCSIFAQLKKQNGGGYCYNVTYCYIKLTFYVWIFSFFQWNFFWSIFFTFLIVYFIYGGTIFNFFVFCSSTYLHLRLNKSLVNWLSWDEKICTCMSLFFSFGLIYHVIL